MANLEEMAAAFRNEGYSEINAEARVCQDIVLSAIAKGSLSRNVTIKGGVVMRGITGNIRRATQDMDLDSIRYEFHLDQEINDRGIMIDQKMVAQALRIDELSKGDLTARIQKRPGWKISTRSCK